MSGVNTAKHVTVLQWKRIQAAGGDFLNPGALAGFLLQESSLPARSRGKGTSRVMQPGKAFEFLLDFSFFLAAWHCCAATSLFSVGSVLSRPV